MEAQKKKITRRRFLSVCATAGACAALPWANALASTPLHRWNGILLGANTHLTLTHPSKETANAIFEQCVREIKRLENIFTLYDTHSELSRLNKNGVLESPSPEMIDILQKAKHFNNITNGAFDITVGAIETNGNLSLVGTNKIDIQKHKIHFKKTGMRITLNGIAQGYITDHITMLLKDQGLNNVLVELGEKRTLGPHPSGRPWMIHMPAQQKSAELNNMALATSSSLNGDTQKPHIINSANGLFVTSTKTVSVMAKTATMADALSTAFLSMKNEHIMKIKSNQPDIARIYN